MYVQGGEAWLSIDLSGDSLHWRGYRSRGGAAPLKETLAAAMILLSYWRPDRPLPPAMIERALLAMLEGDD